MVELLAENLETTSAHVAALGWLKGGEAITSLAAAGEGNMNRTLRASTGERSFILKQSVPFVAKYPQIQAPEDRIEIEAQFYSAITDHPELARRVPEVLGYDPDNRLLCLQDLGPGRDFTDMYQRSDAAEVRTEQLSALVRWLSTLHAIPVAQTSLSERLENRAMRELNHTHIFQIPLDPDNGLALGPALTTIAAEFAADAGLKHQADKLGEVYLGNAEHGSADVLLHGDFYPGSWLQHPSLGVTVIDPEFAFVGAPEFDVGVLRAHLTMSGYAHTEQLLGAYSPPPGFDPSLALGFSGMEIIRRLLGVAQLPLAADDDTRIAWLTNARSLVMSASLPPA